MSGQPFVDLARLSRVWGAMAAAAPLLLPFLGIGEVQPAAVAQEVVRVQSLEERGVVSAVSIHGTTATVTRRITVNAGPGPVEVTVPDLPPAVRTDSFRAHAGAGVSLESVELALMESASSFRLRRTEFEAARAPLVSRRAELEEQLQVLAKEERFFDAIAERVAGGTAQQAAGGALNTSELTSTVKFLSERQEDILKRRREVTGKLEDAKRQIRDLEEANTDLLGLRPIRRPAVILLLNVGPEATGPVIVDLSYEVESVSWRPSYTLRTEPDGSASVLEFDAVVTQATGEDWVEVDLELSTTAMLSSAKPPEVKPWWIEVDEGQSPPMQPLIETEASGDQSTPVATDGEVFSALTGSVPWEGVAGTEIPMTSFRVAQPVTVLSGGGDKGSLPQQVVISTVRGTPNLRYYAAPLVCEYAFLRGSMQNTSRHHLLPGPVRLFLGGQYTGEARMPYTAPGRRFDTFFGVDRRVLVDRRIDSRRTRITGILQDGVETQVEYRLLIANNTGQSINVELWDRSAATHDDRIRISATNLSDPLSTDDIYRAEARPKGLLRWDLSIPASNSFGRERAVTYTLVISHRRDVQTTALPE